MGQAERRLLLGEAWQDLDLVLHAGNGEPMRARTVQAAFSELMESAKLRPFTFHALRHGHSIALPVGGTNPKVVSERLGHASVAFTMDVYRRPVGCGVLSGHRWTSNMGGRVGIA